MAGLSELQQRILSEPEEFWQENVFTIANTVIDPIGDVSEVANIEIALRGLVEHDYIIMGFETFYPRNPEKLTSEETLVILTDLREWFKFDGTDAHWTISKGDMRTERYPVIASTEAGRKEALNILNRRGYQWWRPRK